MDLQYFNDAVHEELEGARDYIVRAMEIKSMDSSWAEKFADMSEEELGHARTMFDMFETFYSIMEKNVTDMPQCFKSMREHLVAYYMDKSATVKHMHELFSK